MCYASSSHFSIPKLGMCWLKKKRIYFFLLSFLVNGESESYSFVICVLCKSSKYVQERRETNQGNGKSMLLFLVKKRDNKNRRKR